MLGELGEDGVVGVLGELGELGAGADVGLAVGCNVGFESTEYTDEIVTLLKPRSDATVSLNEDASKVVVMDVVHDDVSSSPTSESDTDM